MNSVKKMMEVTPEWVLCISSISMQADSLGNVNLTASRNSFSDNISVALKTLGIVYTLTLEDDEIGESWLKFIFKYEDIREECPMIWISMIEQLDPNDVSEIDFLRSFYMRFATSQKPNGKI